jgi:hypothetical protein
VRSHLLIYNLCDYPKTNIFIIESDVNLMYMCSRTPMNCLVANLSQGEVPSPESLQFDL